MLKNQKIKPKISIKSNTKATHPKRRNSIDKELSATSSKQSTPTSSSSTNKIKLNTQDKESKQNSQDYSLDLSINSLEIVKETFNIREKILGSLKTFKNVNKEYITQNHILLNEVDVFEENFLNVKNDISEILLESARSKEELSKMKLIIESPKSKVPESEILEFDMSSVKVQKEEILYDALKHLQNEVNQMKEKIENNEKYIREKDYENNKLRSVAYKLRDSLTIETFTIETEENRPACTSCCLF